MIDHSPAFIRPILARNAELTTVADALDYLATLGPDMWMDEEYQATRECLVAASDTRQRAAIDRATVRLSRFLAVHETLA